MSVPEAYHFLFLTAYPKEVDFGGYLVKCLKKDGDVIFFKDHNLSTDTPNLYYKGQFVQSCEISRIKHKNTYSLVLKNLVIIEYGKLFKLDQVILSEDKLVFKYEIERHLVSHSHLNPFELSLKLGQSDTKYPLYCFVVTEWGHKSDIFNKNEFYWSLGTGRIDHHWFTYQVKSNDLNLEKLSRLLSAYYSAILEKSLAEIKILKEKIPKLDSEAYQTERKIVENKIDGEIKKIEKLVVSFRNKKLKDLSVSEYSLEYKIDERLKKIKEIKEKFVQKPVAKDIEHAKNLLNILKEISTNIKNKRDVFEQADKFYVYNFELFKQGRFIENVKPKVVTSKNPTISISSWKPYFENDPHPSLEMRFGCRALSKWSYGDTYKDAVRVEIIKKNKD